MEISPFYLFTNVFSPVSSGPTILLNGMYEFVPRNNPKETDVNAK